MIYSTGQRNDSFTGATSTTFFVPFCTLAAMQACCVLFQYMLIQFLNNVGYKKAQKKQYAVPFLLSPYAEIQKAIFS